MGKDRHHRLLKFVHKTRKKRARDESTKLKSIRHEFHSITTDSLINKMRSTKRPPNMNKKNSQASPIHVILQPEKALINLIKAYTHPHRENIIVGCYVHTWMSVCLNYTQFSFHYIIASLPSLALPLSATNRANVIPPFFCCVAPMWHSL